MENGIAHFAAGEQDICSLWSSASSFSCAAAFNVFNFTYDCGSTFTAAETEEYQQRLRDESKCEVRMIMLAIGESVCVSVLSTDEHLNG